MPNVLNIGSGGGAGISSGVAAQSTGYQIVGKGTLGQAAPAAPTGIIPSSNIVSVNAAAPTAQAPSVLSKAPAAGAAGGVLGGGTPTISQNVAQKASDVLNAGWVILLLASAGYLFSETRLIGPLLAILLSIATIFQLNQWVQSRGGSIL